ncbi:YggS family pyridoxal phosphate-dependent enzyme [Echinicola shivajiensis]|uniref:YggS family pyridoxal phosphate-dependent enzyme n=1 Tax=Echinicola shivajiensis TaxID=1035916 RepID=UPI001BFC6CEE|nr:YggS family pyridoxal phosphate-dependent enzyme [Echinicola shivajiensis]
MSIKENLSDLKNQFKKTDCLLVAVSKTKPVSDIQEAYDAGIRDFGENKVQELVDKHPLLPDDIQWHMIGHLQRNKVKYIAPFIHLIHGVDTFKLLKEINKQAKKAERIIPCLLQIHIAKEETKFGFSEEEILELLQEGAFDELENVRIIGLMGMATNTDDENQVRKEFAWLRGFLDQLNTKKLPNNFALKELSMGMSGDFLIAQEEGSTMVRVGSAIFGRRNYR